MSENDDSSYTKGKPINKDYKRKRTTMKQAKEDGKLLLICEHCPQNKKKTYLSYPALYYHVRGKHPDKKVTSSKTKNKEKQIEPAPVLKLKSILKTNDNDREEIERELFDIKQYLCLKISQAFLNKMVEFSQIGEKGAQKYMKDVLRQSERLAEQIRLKKSIFLEAVGGEIFQQYYTKIVPISFGKDVVRYFAKNIEFASKIHLQTVLMQALDQSLIDKAQFRDFQFNLWGNYAGLVAPMKDQWLKWKAINKEILNMDYSEEEANEDGTL